MIQVTPVIHAVEERIGQPAEEDRPKPENIHLFDRVPGVGQILIADALFEKGIRLLENDYLGGSGSRGYGQIKFGEMKKTELSDANNWTA